MFLDINTSDTGRTADFRSSTKTSIARNDPFRPGRIKCQHTLMYHRHDTPQADNSSSSSDSTDDKRCTIPSSAFDNFEKTRYHCAAIDALPEDLSCEDMYLLEDGCIVFTIIDADGIMSWRFCTGSKECEIHRLDDENDTEKDHHSDANNRENASPISTPNAPNVLPVPTCQQEEAKIRSTFIKHLNHSSISTRKTLNYVQVDTNQRISELQNRCEELFYAYYGLGSQIMQLCRRHDQLLHMSQEMACQLGHHARVLQRLDSVHDGDTETYQEDQRAENVVNIMPSPSSSPTAENPNSVTNNSPAPNQATGEAIAHEIEGDERVPPTGLVENEKLPATRNDFSSITRAAASSPPQKISQTSTSTSTTTTTSVNAGTDTSADANIIDQPSKQSGPPPTPSSLPLHPAPTAPPIQPDTCRAQRTRKRKAPRSSYDMMNPAKQNRL